MSYQNQLICGRDAARLLGISWRTWTRYVERLELTPAHAIQGHPVWALGELCNLLRQRDLMEARRRRGELERLGVPADALDREESEWRAQPPAYEQVSPGAE